MVRDHFTFVFSNKIVSVDRTLETQYTFWSHIPIVLTTNDANMLRLSKATYALTSITTAAAVKPAFDVITGKWNGAN